MGQKSADQIAWNAEYIIAEELTEVKSSGLISSSTLLFDKPIIDYISQREKPKFLLTNKKQGFRIISPDGSEKTPHHNCNGKKYLLITDQRVLYVAGCSSGDKSIEFDYSEITGTKVFDAGSAALFIKTQAGTEYKFLARHSLSAADPVARAHEYISKRGSTTVNYKKAIGDVTRSQLENSKEGYLGQDKWGEPLINSIRRREQPHFLFKLSNSYQNGREIADTGNLRETEFLIVTDQRVLHIARREYDNDVLEINYVNISDAEMNTNSILADATSIDNIKISTEDTIYKFDPYTKSVDYDEVKKAINYISEMKYATAEQQDTISQFIYTGHFYNPNPSNLEFVSEDDLISNGDYTCRFKQDHVAVADKKVPYESILDADEIDKYSGKNYVRIIYSNDEERGTYHLYLYDDTNTNLTGSNDYRHLINILDKNTDYEQHNEKLPKYLVNDWVAPNPELRIEGWEEGSTMTGSMTGDINTTGTIEAESSGYQVGTVTGSEIEGNISTTSSVNTRINTRISDSTYTSDVQTIQIYENRLYIHSDPIINVEFSEINRIMKRDSGFTLKIGNESYTITKIGDDISEAIEFIRSNMTENKEETDADSSNDKTPTEKIRELKSLHEEGILTDEEFESKKEELLDDF